METVKVQKRAKNNENKRFTAKELGEIIRECKQQGVSELSFGDLRVLFGTSANKDLTQEIPAKAQPITTSQHEVQNKEAIEQAELEYRDQQIAELMITNPLEAERLINSEELVEDDLDDDRSPE